METWMEFWIHFPQMGRIAILGLFLFIVIDMLFSIIRKVRQYNKLVEQNERENETNPIRSGPNWKAEQALLEIEENKRDNRTETAKGENGPINTPTKD